MYEKSRKHLSERIVDGKCENEKREQGSHEGNWEARGRNRRNPMSAIRSFVSLCRDNSPLSGDRQTKKTR